MYNPQNPTNLIEATLAFSFALFGTAVKIATTYPDMISYGLQWLAWGAAIAVSIKALLKRTRKR